MRGTNHVRLRGFTGADPEIYSGDNYTLANVRLATDEGFTNRDGEKVDHTEWHNLVFSGRLAEVIEQYISKGSHIEVVGRLRTESWEDGDGNTRYTTKIRVSELNIISTPNEEDGSERSKSNTKAKPKASKAKTTRAKSTGRKATKAKATADVDDGLPY